MAYTVIELAKVSDRAGEFDLIHNHIDYFGSLVTLHPDAGRHNVTPAHSVFREIAEKRRDTQWKNHAVFWWG